jgi:tetratricopeptide (TPR) repeat protein
MEKNRLAFLISEGKSFFNKNEFKSALGAFQECIEIDPYNIESFFFLANIFHLQGDIGKAIKAFKKVLEIDPGHTEASISLSVILNDIGKYDEAKKVFENLNSSALSSSGGVNDAHINKKFSQRHMELGDMYVVYQRYDEAMEQYNKSVQLDSSNLDVRVKVAKVFEKK